MAGKPGHIMHLSKQLARAAGRKADKNLRSRRRSGLIFRVFWCRICFLVRCKHLFHSHRSVSGRHNIPPGWPGGGKCDLRMSGSRQNFSCRAGGDVRKTNTKRRRRRRRRGRRRRRRRRKKKMKDKTHPKQQVIDGQSWQTSMAK